MSSILYYSNFCDHSKKLLQMVSKTQLSNDIHFICIDKRVKEGNKLFIVLPNGQKIVMPENITKVPALLLLNQNYKVLYGDAIYDYMKPRQQTSIKQATQNNMEPMGLSFGGGCGIASDQFSFLDMDSDSLGTKGNGGMRQMHNYVSLQDSQNMTMSCPTDDTQYNSKLKDGDMKIEDLQRRREQEISGISYRK